MYVFVDIHTLGRGIVYIVYMYITVDFELDIVDCGSYILGYRLYILYQ